MSTGDLLAHLAAHGAVLEVSRTGIVLDAPTSVLKDPLVRQLRAGRDELRSVIQQAIARTAAPIDHTTTLLRPPSPGQHRLWRMTGQRDDGAAYNVPLVVELRGDLDQALLTQSLDLLHRRHPSLRAHFLTIDGVLFQVAGACPAPVNVTDLHDLPPEEATRVAHQTIAASLDRSFDLARPPLWRCDVLALSSTQTILAIVVHHIVFDLTSKDILLQELGNIYTALKTGRAIAQDTSVERPPVAATEGTSLKYWTDHLQGLRTELLLPTTRARRGNRHAPAADAEVAVPPDVTAALQRLAREEGGGLHHIGLAGLHALLHTFTAQVDQVICTPFANRTEPGSETSIGYLSNVLPMRTDLSGNPTFREVVRRVRHNVLRALAHQDVPFDQVAATTRVPLTRGLFNYRGDQIPTVPIPELETRRLTYRRTRADFDIALYLGLSNGYLRGELEYNADLFDDARSHELVQDFVQLLTTAAGAPDTRIRDLPCRPRRYVDVEAALATHSSVKEVRVEVRSDMVGALLGAYVVANEDNPPNPTDLHAAVVEDHPSAPPISFTVVDRLPRHRDGEVNRAALPSTNVDRGDFLGPYVTPRSSLEFMLAELWRQALWLRRPVGIDDDFGDLGGHSLLAVQILAQAEETLGTRVPLETIGPLTTVRDLATILQRPSDSPRSEGNDRLETMLRQIRMYTSGWRGARLRPDSLSTGLNTTGERVPLFWVVQGFGQLSLLAGLLGPDQPIYGMRSGYNVVDYHTDDASMLAERYVREVQDICPEGPFIIGGICQSTHIAFEMALHMQALDRPPLLLCLQERFIARPYKGDVAMIFGRDSDRSPYYHFAHPELGWAKYYTGAVKPYIIPGAHGTFFQDHTAPALVASIRDAIDFIPHRSTPRTRQTQPLPSSARHATYALLDLQAVPSGGHRAQVLVTNTSPATWPAASVSGLFLGARWRNPTAQDPRGHDRYVFCNESRSALDRPVAPGQDVVITIHVGRHDDLGSQTVEISMVEEGVCWFSDVGVPGLHVDVGR